MNFGKINCDVSECILIAEKFNIVSRKTIEFLSPVLIYNINLGGACT